jgi:hypothetical protein
LPAFHADGLTVRVPGILNPFVEYDVVRTYQRYLV